MWLTYAFVAALRFMPTPADDASIRAAMVRIFTAAPRESAVMEPAAWSGRMTLPVGVISICMLSPDLAEVRAVQSEVGSVFFGRREFRVKLRRVGETWGTTP